MHLGLTCSASHLLCGYSVDERAMWMFAIFWILVQKSRFSSTISVLLYEISSSEARNINTFYIKPIMLYHILAI